MTIRTKRLVLRAWHEEDSKFFAQMNSDPRVMEHFPTTLSLQESNDLAKRLSAKLQEQGWGLWAVSVPEISDFIGFIGLSEPSFNAHFTPFFLLSKTFKRLIKRQKQWKAWDMKLKVNMVLLFVAIFKKARTLELTMYMFMKKAIPKSNRYLKFRDWMRSHGDDAQAYANLKTDPRDIEIGKLLV
jgi:hypothetical protein